MNFLGRGGKKFDRKTVHQEIRIPRRSGRSLRAPSAARGACPIGLLIVWGRNLKTSQEIASSLRSSQ